MTSVQENPRMIPKKSIDFGTGTCYDVVVECQGRG